MTSLKLMAAIVVLPIAFAVPAIAQQAVQEPGEQAFYESLGVGSATRTSAMASAENAGVVMAVHTKHHRSTSLKVTHR